MKFQVHINIECYHLNGSLNFEDGSVWDLVFFPSFFFDYYVNQIQPAPLYLCTISMNYTLYIDLSQNLNYYQTFHIVSLPASFESFMFTTHLFIQISDIRPYDRLIAKLRHILTQWRMLREERKQSIFGYSNK